MLPKALQAGTCGLAILFSCAFGLAGEALASERCVGTICIDVVAVENAGNNPDPDTGLGAVSHAFAIGSYEVTVGQYVQFLNSVATRPMDLPVDKRAAIEELWQPDMLHTHAYVVPNGVVARSGAGTAAQPFAYAEIPDEHLGAQSSRRGMLNISWFAAARFANWLHNGARDDSSTETGAYTLNYQRKGVVARNPGARWWIPSADEWYKAAYFDPARLASNPYWTYPTRSDELPVAEAPPGNGNSANYNSVGADGRKLTAVGAYTAAASHYGTFDQAGLLWEWTDTSFANHDGVPQTMAMFGGSWSLGLINISKFGSRDYLPDYNDDDTGFRLATTLEVSQ